MLDLHEEILKSMRAIILVGAYWFLPGVLADGVPVARAARSGLAWHQAPRYGLAVRTFRGLIP